MLLFNDDSLDSMAVAKKEAALELNAPHRWNSNHSDAHLRFRAPPSNSLVLDSHGYDIKLRRLDSFFRHFDLKWFVIAEVLVLLFLELALKKKRL